MDNMEYLKPKNLKEAFEAVERTVGLAKFIAGGTNLIPEMRAESISPGLLIDLSFLEGLDDIREENGIMAIGALTAISRIAISEIIRKKVPVLSAAAGRLGNPLTRNRATVGGNLADASPAADMAPPLLALEASLHTERAGGAAREIPLDRFFLGPNKTMLAKDEIITKITFRTPKESEKGSYIKLGLRDSMAVSVVSIAVMLEMNGGVCRKARVALGAVAPTPIRVRRVEKTLEGKEIDSKLIEKCSVMVQEEISPISDIRASAEYRKLVTSVLLRRGVENALREGKI